VNGTKVFKDMAVDVCGFRGRSTSCSDAFKLSQYDGDS